MNRLIESLNIFKKYQISEKYIFFDDGSFNIDVKHNDFQKKDLDRLRELGWGIAPDNGTLHWYGVN